MNNYYTYAYLREDGTPYYIGKGTGRRIDNPGTHYSGLPPKKRRIILKQNLTEQEAFKHEIYMIFVFGRKDLGTGILRNLTNGGEGKSGWKMSEKTKEKIRKSNIGKKRSLEQRMVFSQSHKNKPLSEENKRNISKALKEMGHLPPLHKNTKWWNNGQISKRSVECPGKEWISGRLPLGPYNRKK